MNMLATFNDWMLGLPAVLQLLVAFAVLFAIGSIPLLMWLAYAVVSTPDVVPGRRDSQQP
jgi:hypothetical protein